MPKTWRYQINKLLEKGKYEEITSGASPFDPKASTIMAAEYLKENFTAGIKNLVPKIGLVDSYLIALLRPMEI
jgi:hypothetical protein